MVFDGRAALTLAETTAVAFSEGLRGLVAHVEEELDAQRQLLAEESRSIGEGRAHLEESCARLEVERCEATASLEELAAEAVRLAADRDTLHRQGEELKADRLRFDDDRRLWGGDIVHFNVSGAAQVSMLRSTATVCGESMLSSLLSGRWPVPRDEEGRIYVDFPPQLFLPLVEHMQLRSIEDPEEPAAPPALEPEELQNQFEQMLRYLGMLEWVYRPEPIEQSVVIGRHFYATLPPQAPEEAVVGRDMQDLILEVPRGWEVLSSSSQGFQPTIEELTSYCWGTQVLCVLNGQGGFDGYRTSLKTVGGPPGSIFQADIDWLEAVDAARQFRFRGLSGRLVIRARCDAIGGDAAPSGGEMQFE